jgi:hypothetical protein
MVIHWLGDIKELVPFGPIPLQRPEIHGPTLKARVGSLRGMDRLKGNMPAAGLGHDLNSHTGWLAIADMEEIAGSRCGRAWNSWRDPAR